jgi:signal transduction histidine kinase
MGDTEGTRSTRATGERSAPRSWLSGRLTDVGRGTALHLLVYPGTAVLLLATLAMGLLGLGVGVLLLPTAMAAVRRSADRRRELVGRWTGTAIASPYRPYRPRPDAVPDGWTGRLRRCQWLLTDPATWRELLWLLVDPIVGGFLALLPLALILEGVFGFVLTAFAGPMTRAGYDDWYLFVHVRSGHTESVTTSTIGVALIAVGLWCAPRMLARYGRWSGVLLSPTPSAQLVERVQQLTETRTDAVDAQAAELRRIERDLHDGAQARLVAMGMNLGAAAQLLESNPEQARLLMLEARDASARALTELRDLVRGIHPPVLSDRGLGDAVRALALDSALAVEVTVDLPGRLEPAVESAAYFATAEALTNAAKHAEATRVWIGLHHAGGRLVITVQDDGRGGADPARGTGLRGIERRLATFDGILALSSPLGGPTVITVELPCVLSSPKTSSS